MNDLISRQAAIDALWSLEVELRPSAIDAILNKLNALPSAQHGSVESTANEEERRAMELWNAITTAIYVSGHRGEDVTLLGIETLKKLGRYDLLPPCEKNKTREEDLINRAAKYFLDAFLKEETDG